MNDKDAFGCTTFRKGNYLGRSYDFYCNDVASSVLHTSGIEGVRYESIGMSGSSFNGMVKEKAMDGTIDKATMDKLFGSIVDGINEKGVAISALVVPRGDKGITTGTNKGKATIPAKMVPRVVLDKAYSAKGAIKLLSELNIIQDWGTEYELHWMIADADDTYIVETVNNKLSYIGPEAIEGIEEFYNGTLEADVVTNFYQTGFKSSFANTYVTTQNWGKETRVYEVPQPSDADGGYYEYADGSYVEVRSGEYVKMWGTDHGVIDDVLEDDKYYIVTTKHEDGTWTFSGVTLEVRENEPLYHADGTPVDMPLLGEYVEGVSGGYNTFEMPINNPTVTPHGCGLERYKAIKDKLAQVNGDLADDEEAMGIINLVQYTNAYKDDNDWYTEFVDHEYDNRSPLVAKGLAPSGKLSDAVYTNGSTTYHEVFPPKDESYFNYSHYDTLGFTIGSESLKNAQYIYGGCTAHTGDFWNERVEGFTFDESKWYIENGSAPGTKFIPLGKTDVVYRKYESSTLIIGDLIYSESEIPSEYVNKVNELRTTYNQILSEGGKDAVREIGLTWHSNHQCIYDLDNKTMLVYPSENGEVAYRVNIHGVVEDEAVEIESGEDSTPSNICPPIEKAVGHYSDATRPSPNTVYVFEVELPSEEVLNSYGNYNIYPKDFNEEDYNWWGIVYFGSDIQLFYPDYTGKPLKDDSFYYALYYWEDVGKFGDINANYFDIENDELYAYKIDEETWEGPAVPFVREPLIFKSAESGEGEELPPLIYLGVDGEGYNYVGGLKEYSFVDSEGRDDWRLSIGGSVTNVATCNGCTYFTNGGCTLNPDVGPFLEAHPEYTVGCFTGNPPVILMNGPAGEEVYTLEW